jgi:transposase
MIPEKLFEKLLVLGDAWRVKSVDYVEEQSKVVICVEETPQLWASQKCPHCEAASVAGYDHAPERSWRHLNVCQLESEITCALPRGQCRKCRKVFTVRAPWEGRSRGLTQEFEAFALTLVRATWLARRSNPSEIFRSKSPRLFAVIRRQPAKAAWAASTAWATWLRAITAMRAKTLPVAGLTTGELWPVSTNLPFR